MNNIVKPVESQGMQIINCFVLTLHPFLALVFVEGVFRSLKLLLKSSLAVKFCKDSEANHFLNCIWRFCMFRLFLCQDYALDRFLFSRRKRGSGAVMILPPLVLLCCDVMTHKAWLFSKLKVLNKTASMWASTLQSICSKFYIFSHQGLTNHASIFTANFFKWITNMLDPSPLEWKPFCIQITHPKPRHQSKAPQCFHLDKALILWHCCGHATCWYCLKVCMCWAFCS